MLRGFVLGLVVVLLVAVLVLAARTSWVTPDGYMPPQQQHSGGAVK